MENSIENLLETVQSGSKPFDDAADIIAHHEERAAILEAAGGKVSIIGSKRQTIGLPSVFEDMIGQTVSIKFVAERAPEATEYPANQERNPGKKDVYLSSNFYISVHHEPSGTDVIGAQSLSTNEIRALLEIDNWATSSGFSVEIVKDKRNNISGANLKFEGDSLELYGNKIAQAEKSKPETEEKKKGLKGLK